MNPHSVRIYYFRTAADSSKVKATFAILDKIFHFSMAAVKLDDLIGFHIHVRNNKSVHVY